MTGTASMEHPDEDLRAFLEADVGQRQTKPPAPKLTLRRRAVLFLILLVVLLSGLLSYVFYRSVSRMLTEELQRRGDAIASSIAESSTLGVLLQDKVILIQVATYFLNEKDVKYVWITDRNGVPIFPSASTFTVTPTAGPILMDTLKNKGKTFRFGNLGQVVSGQGAFNGYHVAVPVWREAANDLLEGNPAEADSLPDRVGVMHGKGAELIGIVQVGLSTERIEKQVRDVMFRVGFLVVVVAFIGMTVAATLLNRWLEPLQGVTALARNIRTLGYTSAVGRTEDEVEKFVEHMPNLPARGDEIGLLNQTFIEMVKEIGVHDRRLREQKERLKQVVAEQIEQLAAAKEEALAANRAKSTFLASMSHELRTPLNAVLGYTEMLQYGLARDAEKQAEYLTIIYSSGRHLLSLINDILDLSKLEEGRYEIHTSPFDLLPCVEQAFAFNQPRIKEKSIESRLECPDIEVVNDERMLKQILVNLISNAVKFTPEEGRVEILVEEQDEFLAITIADTGDGMTEEEVEQALKPFIQIAGEQHVRRNEGTGLGLPIVDRFVTLMKGKLSIFSEKGEGTVVRIRIPKTVGQGEYCI